ncbi:MAG: hypothetical protein KF841_02090 [Phycisphaerae bacterium]|nr:hypothetical protein [Phycisphaerae bacterium]
MNFRIMHGLCLLAVLSINMPAVIATPIEIDVDTGLSSVTVQYCLGANCANDSSPVIGLTVLKLDSIASPAQIQLHDFFFALTEDIQLNLTGLSAVGAGMMFEYATPGVPTEPEPVGPGGGFSLFDVPANQSGIVSYTATGTTCLLLTFAGYPCAGAIDLSQQGTQLGYFTGIVETLPGRVVRLTLHPEISGPLDPANPALGTVSITGTVVGMAAIPLRGDANLDGAVDAADIQPFVDTLLDPGAQSWQRRFAVDMDDDDTFDSFDAARLVDCLIEGQCGD